VSDQDFFKVMSRILAYEGGLADDPRDPGGRTNEGVTQATYDAWRSEYLLPPRDVDLMQSWERDAIYKSRYWRPIQGDRLGLGLGLCVMDAAVNSGPPHAGLWLQQALGARYKGALDGAIGPETLQAVADYGPLGGLVAAYCALRLATLQHLPDWREYGRGWGARVADVQRTADAWLAGSEPPVGDGVTPINSRRKAVFNAMGRSDP
jgi:lysozyme family protein